MEVTNQPTVVADSTVIGFGCVSIQTTAHSSISLRCVSTSITTIHLSIRPYHSHSSITAYKLQSSPTVSLQPGETTTVLLSYTPLAVQEDLGLLLISSPSSTNPQVLSIVGYGGCCSASITEKNQSLVIGNSGDRTACFFTLGINKNQFSLIKSSDLLPPFFMVPSMMEFTISGETIAKEIQDKKLPNTIHIIAIDNILKRRLLLGINRNALVRCSEPFEVLLLQAVHETSESIASTHSLLKTINQLQGNINDIDITRDMEDGELLADFDTLLGREKTAFSHYLDMKMITSHLMAVTVHLDQIGGLSHISSSIPVFDPMNRTSSIPLDSIPVRETRDSYNNIHNENPLNIGLGTVNETPVENRDYFGHLPQDDGILPSIYDSLNKPSDTAVTYVSVIPQFLYITQGELKKDDISIFNHSNHDVFFSVGVSWAFHV